MWSDGGLLPEDLFKFVCRSRNIFTIADALADEQVSSDILDHGAGDSDLSAVTHTWTMTHSSQMHMHASARLMLTAWTAFRVT